MSLSIRPATAADAELVLSFIRELAEYEKLSHAVEATPARLHATLFCDRPVAEALFVSVEGREVGFALFFQTYSTFLAKPGLYLEDLFVRPEARGRGAGKALMVHLARLAVARGCGRFEWSVLDWNRPAIDFYRSIGAVGMDEWTVQRVTGDALATLAAQPMPE